MFPRDSRLVLTKITVCALLLERHVLWQVGAGGPISQPVPLHMG